MVAAPAERTTARRLLRAVARVGVEGMKCPSAADGDVNDAAVAGNVDMVATVLGFVVAVLTFNDDAPRWEADAETAAAAAPVSSDADEDTFITISWNMLTDEISRVAAGDAAKLVSINVAVAAVAAVGSARAAATSECIAVMEGAACVVVAAVSVDGWRWRSSALWSMLVVTITEEFCEYECFRVCACDG